MKYFISYITSIITLIILDWVWLKFLAKDFYFNRIGSLYRESANWAPIVLFYLLYAGAIVFFAVRGVTSSKGALMMGAFLGFTVYMTYNFVNLGVIKNWSASVTVVDILWGTALTGASALIAYIVFTL